MGRKGERIRRPKSKPLTKMGPMPDLGGALIGLLSPTLMARMNGRDGVRENANKAHIASLEAAAVMEGKKETFVQSHNRPSAPAGGVNSPCPCNSGRKFKKCCGKAPSYEVQDGNHILKVEEPKAAKVKELNFQNLAGLDEAKIEAHFNTEGTTTSRYSGSEENASASPNMSFDEGRATADNAVHADGVSAGA